MNKKIKFQEPEIEVIYFLDDVIATSATDPTKPFDITEQFNEEKTVPYYEQ